MSFDYFYNQEIEKYTYYTLPKLFFENEELNKLSINAKFLYSILLDRAKSSYKNGFIDNENKVYVHYSQSKMMKLLHVERTQLYKYLNELDVKKGIGLIERKQKLGRGKTDIIYIKNFAKPTDNNTLPTSDSDGKYKYFCDDISVERFKFYSLPKIFFYDLDYVKKHTYSDSILELQSLSGNAKMTYFYFLELLKLSMSKGKKDEYGRFYIICPEKDLQNLLGCCLKTVRQILNQLDIKNGVGLIERSTDNPNIIYVLDYTGSLNHNVDLKRQESEHQKEKSEHPYNNTDSIDTDSIDNHSINQSFAEAQSDRQTDRLKNSQKKMSFSEMLTAIGYRTRFGDVPEDESYFEGCEEKERDINKLTIPYWLQSNPQGLKEALKFIFSYSSYSSKKYEEIRKLLDAVIKSLVEMIKKDHVKLDGEYVKYYQIIDAINNIMHNSSPMEWLDSFKDEWSKILSERRDISNVMAYLKTCIWNSLNEFEFKENNASLQGSYDCAHGFPGKKTVQNFKNENHNDDTFDVDKYKVFINDYTVI